MVQQYDDPFDQILLGGGSGPAYWSFGMTPSVGQYIEGVLKEKKSRYSTAFQPKAQRDAGSPAQYEYFKGKSKITSSKTPEEMKLEDPTARPIIELVLVLQTNLIDPNKEGDTGLRQFVLPRDAKDKLAAAVKAQGLAGGLPLESFIRVTLTEFQAVEGLPTPKRIYSVEVWGPGEQPSPSPAQPAAQQPQYQQVVAAPPTAQGVQQPPVQQPATVVQSTPQLSPDLIKQMVQSGMPMTPEVEQIARNLGLINA